MSAQQTALELPEVVRVVAAHADTNNSRRTLLASVGPGFGHTVGRCSGLHAQGKVK